MASATIPATTLTHSPEAKTAQSVEESSLRNSSRWGVLEGQLLSVQIGSGGQPYCCSLRQRRQQGSACFQRREQGNGSLTGWRLFRLAGLYEPMAQRSRGSECTTSVRLALRSPILSHHACRTGGKCFGEWHRASWPSAPPRHLRLLAFAVCFNLQKCARRTPHQRPPETLKPSAPLTTPLRRP